MGYAEKLLDPRWQRKRLEVLDADGWSCQNCGATDKTLHVHHLLYERGKDPWDYDNKRLISLCEDCHDAIETARPDILAIMAEYPPDFLIDFTWRAPKMSQRPWQHCLHPFERWTKWIEAARRIRLEK